MTEAERQEILTFLKINLPIENGYELLFDLLSNSKSTFDDVLYCCKAMDRIGWRLPRDCPAYLFSNKTPEYLDYYYDMIADAKFYRKCLDVFHEVEIDPNKNKDVFSNVIHHSNKNSHEEFRFLKSKGVTFSHHSELFIEVSEIKADAFAVIDAISTLEKEGVNLKDHSKLFVAAIKNYYRVHHIAHAFRVLKFHGATLKDNIALHEKAIENANNAKYFERTFSLLSKMGATVKDNQALFILAMSLAQNEYYHSAFQECMGVLSDAGFNIKSHPIFFEVIANNPFKLDLSQIFLALTQLGATKDSHPKLYLSVLSSPASSETLTKIISALTKHGANVVDHEWAFLAFINNWTVVDSLEILFTLLTQAGATFSNNPALFNIIMQDDIDDVKLKHGFQALIEIGATINNAEGLFAQVMRLSDHLLDVTRMKLGFAALKTVNASVVQDSDLYLKAMENASFAEWFLPAFAALKDLGANIEEHRELFLAIMPYANFTSKIVLCISLLQAKGATLKNDANLFLKTIEGAKYLDGEKLKSVFSELQNFSATLPENPELYLQAIVVHARAVNSFYPNLLALKEMGATLLEHKEHYLRAISSTQDNRFLACLTLFKKMHGSINNHMEWLTQIYDNADLNHLERIVQSFANKPYLFPYLFSDFKNLPNVENVLKYLEHKNFNIDSELTLFKAAAKYPETVQMLIAHVEMLGMKNPDDLYIFKIFFSEEILSSPYLSFTLALNFNYFVKDHPLPRIGQADYAEKSLEIKNFLQSFMERKNVYTQGPLQKTPETNELEIILQKLSVANLNAITVYFDETHGYILKFADEPDIYLNHLLHHVNFNHVDFSPSLIERIGHMINEISGDFNKTDINSDDDSLKKLPISAQRAVFCYVGDRCYKNINRIFRALSPDAEPRYTWITPANGKENLLASFLTGCLVNWAAKQLPLEVLKSLKWEIPKAQSFLLDRGENLANTDELATYERRVANPIITAAVTSVSVSESGSPDFQKPGTVRTKFELQNTARPVLSTSEGEQLIPHGTTLIYTNNPEGGFFAREVNSPSITPTGFYWSKIALSHAFHFHLKIRYKDQASQITVNNKVIYRPNHGLAHTLRVMQLIPIVIDYFAHHANDEAFRLFCRHVTSREQNWLMVAGAFSITGRENEAAAIENLKRYDEFRAASAQHFADFIKANPPKIEDVEMEERMRHIVRYMGNPAYENATNSEPAINQHQDEIERMHRNFIHRILTIAHKLDLPRCYTPDKVKAAMASCVNLSTQNPQQQQDFLQMQLYAIHLIKAHGNALHTDMNDSNELIECHVDYKPPFERASTNLRDAQALIDSVPRPKLTEKYQFPQSDNAELVQTIHEMCHPTPASKKPKPN